MHRRLPIALVVLVLLAGCGGAGDLGGGETATGGDATVTAAESSDGGDGGAVGVQEDSDGTADLDAQANLQSRYRVKTARVDLQVDAYRAARSTLVEETRALGGYVERETTDRHTRGNETWTTGTLVLRVPTEQYDPLMDRVESTGTVQHRESNVKDVTERVVDLRARLQNLRAQRDRLRDLYESANETDAILRVGQRLSEVQGEIERVEGRLQVLESQVAYSTVRVELHEEPPSEPPGSVEPAWYETGVVAAFLASVDGVVVLARMLVVGVAYLLPYALALALPVAGIYGVARRVG